MACCLTLALLFAFLRKLAPGRDPGSAFAPPAFRGYGAPSEPVRRSSGAHREHLAPSRGIGRAVIVGACAGGAAYLVDVILLVALGTVEAEVAVRLATAAVLAVGVAAAWRSVRPAWRPADTRVVVGAAGLAFGVLGLVEMHAFGSVTFTSPSLLADVVFHGAGPLVAAWATVALPARRLPGVPGAVR